MLYHGRYSDEQFSVAAQYWGDQLVGKYSGGQIEVFTTTLARVLTRHSHRDPGGISFGTNRRYDSLDENRDGLLPYQPSVSLIESGTDAGIAVDRTTFKLGVVCRIHTDGRVGIIESIDAFLKSCVRMRLGDPGLERIIHSETRGPVSKPAADGAIFQLVL